MSDGLRCSLLSLLISCLSGFAVAQKVSHVAHYADLTLGITSSQTSLSVDYHRDWRLNVAWNPGRIRIMEIGFGPRLTAAFGSDSYLPSVPASIPNPDYRKKPYQAAYIPDPDPAHQDSLLFPSTQVNFLNIMFHWVFFFGERFSIGINWDMIGFSFGATQKATYINGSTTEAVTASPATFNYVLGGVSASQPQGSLIQEFYISYGFWERWSAKLGLVNGCQVEYISATKVQQYPEPNDRFQIRDVGMSFGAMYKFPGKGNNASASPHGRKGRSR